MPGKRVAPDTSVRLVAFIAAAALHVPLFIAWDIRNKPISNADTIRVRWIAEQEPLELQGSAAPALASSATPQAALRTEAAPSRPRVPPEGISRPPVDWEISGAIAAEAAIDAIVRDEAYRPLGPREKKHQIVEPEAPRSIFEEPKRRYGDIAPNALDKTSVWHNEHCYTQLEEPVSARPSSVNPLNPVVCVIPIGKKEPRGDLFEHLKKAYPDPHPKAADPHAD